MLEIMHFALYYTEKEASLFKRLRKSMKNFVQAWTCYCSYVASVMIRWLKNNSVKKASHPEKREWKGRTALTRLRGFCLWGWVIVKKVMIVWLTGRRWHRQRIEIPSRRVADTEFATMRQLPRPGHTERAEAGWKPSPGPCPGDAPALRILPD